MPKNSTALKNKEYRIGIMAGGIDGLFFTKRVLPKNIEIYFLVPNNRPEKKWAQSFLPAQNLIGYNLKNKNISMAVTDFEGLAKNSDLAKHLLKNKINYLFVHHGVTSYLDAWANKHKIRLIATPYKIREKFEDKIYFDNFLKKYQLPKPKSQIYTPTKAKINLSGRLVLQERDSSGSEGTYFGNSLTDLKNKAKIKISQKYLVRQFIPGSAYGLTILILPDTIALSTLRVQCYSQKIFSGLQWLPTRYLKKEIIQKINSVFISLGKKLASQKFLGYANIDFIIDHKDNIYIIECNPRPAASTTHLFGFTQTISGLQADRLYLEQYLFAKKQNKKPKIYYLPKSNFTGSLIYIHSPFDQKNFLLKKSYKNGLYKIGKNNTIIFEAQDVTKINDKNKQFIFYADAVKGEKHKAGTIIGSIISNFPLYDSQGNKNQIAKNILKYFKY